MYLWHFILTQEYPLDHHSYYVQYPQTPEHLLPGKEDLPHTCRTTQEILRYT